MLSCSPKCPLAYPTRPVITTTPHSGKWYLLLYTWLVSGISWPSVEEWVYPWRPARHYPNISDLQNMLAMSLYYEINLRSVTLLTNRRLSESPFYTTLLKAEQGPASQPAEPCCLDHLALSDRASVPHLGEGGRAGRRAGSPVAPRQPLLRVSALSLPLPVSCLQLVQPPYTPGLSTVMCLAT